MWDYVGPRAEHRLGECEEGAGGRVWTQGGASDRRVEITACELHEMY